MKFVYQFLFHLHPCTFIFTRCNGEMKLIYLVAFLFVDRNPVYFLSTFYYPSQLDTLERRGKNGQKLEFEVLEAVTAYNSTRCGVDTLDQLQSYYSIGRKNRRWWSRLA